MEGIEILRRASVGAASTESGRQYLVGNLQEAQALQNIPDDDVEIGIATYHDSEADLPHYHPHVREFQYILKGRLLLRNVKTRETVELFEGDFYVINPGTIHVQKAQQGTRVIFFKFPGMNDKTVVPADEELANWLADLRF